MSEHAPRSNPRLDAFETKKAEAEQAKFEEALYGDAGTTDFSDEARTRAEEADAYERHMEEMANRDNLDPASAEGAAERRNPFANLNDEPSEAYGREWQDAIDENDALDAQLAADRADFEAKLAASAELRMAQRIADQLRELRNTPFDPETSDEMIEREKALESRLEELLIRYSKSADHDPAMADYMVDYSDDVAVGIPKSKKEKAEDKKPESDPLDTDPKDGDDPLDTDPESDDEGEHDPLDGEPEDDDELPELDPFEEADNRTETEATDEERAEAERIDAEFNADPDRVAAHAEARARAEAGGDDDLDTEPEDDDEDPDDGYDELSPEEQAVLDREAYDRMTPEERAALDAEVQAELDAEAAAEREAGRNALSRFIRDRSARLFVIFNGNGGPSIRERLSGSRRSTKIALGAVAFSAAAVAAFATWKYGFHGGGGNHHDTAQAVTQPSGPKGSTGSGATDVFPGAKPPHGVDPSTVPDVHTYSADALHVTPGEGWFHTMRELGITDSESQKLILHNDTVMGKLQDLGVAYKAPDLGGWGINMPSNGQMPKAALDILEQAGKSLNR